MDLAVMSSSLGGGAAAVGARDLPAKPRRAKNHGGGRGRQFGQILITYPQRWPLYLCLALLANHLIALHANYGWDKAPRARAVLLLGSLALVCGAFGMALLEHVKEHLADVRGALIPGYRPPHLIVGVIAFLIYVTFAAATSAAPLNVRFEPILAFATAIAIVAAWAIHLPPLQMPLLLGVIALFGSDPARAALLAMLRGQHSIVSTVLLIADLLAIGLLGWDLATTHEGRRSYARSATSARLPTAANYLWPLSLVRYSDRQIRRSAKIARESFWRRLQHRRIVTAGGWRVSDIGWLLAAAYIALEFSQYSSGFAAPWRDIVLISFPDLVTMAALAAPSILAGFIWPRRWLTIEYELSLPASRMQHVRETIVAMFVDHMALWLTATTGALLYYVYREVRMYYAWALGEHFGWIVRSTGMWLRWWLLPVIPIQILAFAVNLFALRFRSPLASLVIGFTVAGMVVWIQPWTWWFEYSFGMPLYVVANVVLVAIGIALVVAAYCWWSRIDIV